jgi:hypothetical protein
MKRYLVLFCAIMLLLAGVAATASADGPIAFSRSDASYSFQKEVKFTLEASSDSDIVKATLRFRLGDQTATNINEKTVTPARKATVEHTWNLANADLPSGLVITYWWEVQDKAGNKAESERRSFTYEDTRFTWKKLSREDITLFWYRGDDSLGRELLDSAVTAYQRLAQDFGVERKPATIYIYGSFADLRSGIGESAQEWTGGRAYPEFGIVLIGVPPSELAFGKRAVPHEFSHLIVHRATRNPYSGLPRWLDEGIAMWVEGDLEREYRNALDRAVRTNTLLSLKTLSSNFPADSNQATLAYAQSYSVVAYIREQFGAQKLAELLKVFKEGSTDDGALQKVLSLSTEDLDARWRASLGLGVAPHQPGAQTQPSAPVTIQPVAGGVPRWMAVAIGFGLLAGLVIIVVASVIIVAVVTRA